MHITELPLIAKGFSVSMNTLNAFYSNGLIAEEVNPNGIGIGFLAWFMSGTLCTNPI